jgi:hypothetical protein
MQNNAKKNIDCMKDNHQKQFWQNTKRKNLGTANYANFDAAGQERIQKQVLLLMNTSGRKISKSTSVASSVTTASSVILPQGPVKAAEEG